MSRRPRCFPFINRTGVAAACLLGAAGIAVAAEGGPPRGSVPTGRSPGRVASVPATPQPPAPKKPVLLPGTGSLVKNVVRRLRG